MTQDRLDVADRAAVERDAQLAAAMSDLSRLTADLMAVRQTLATLSEDVVAVRQPDSTAELMESARQVVLDDLTRLIHDERRLNQDRLEPLQETLNHLHDEHRSLADRHVSEQAQAVALGVRLAALESAPRTDPEQRARLDRLDSAWEELATGAAALRTQIERLHEQVSARDLPELTDAPLAEIGDAIVALRTDREAVRASLADHEARRAGLEATIARLEAARAEDQHAGAMRWENFEASIRERLRAFEGEVAERQRTFEEATQTRWDEAKARSSARSLEFEHLREQWRTANEAHLTRFDQLAQFASRVTTLETDAVAFRQVVDSLRDQHDTANRDLGNRLRAFEREVERLRESKPTRTLGPQPAVTAGPVIRPVPARSTPESSLPFDSWPDMDSLIDDLVYERSGTEVSPAPVLHQAPSHGPSAPASGRPAKSDQAALAELYATRRNDYYEAMNAARFADAVPSARFLVELTANCTDVPNLDHALWLRNLGISLSMIGEGVEARTQLDAALALCESDAEPAQVPRLMCLFDLVEFCLNRGERWQALDFCERTLNLMNGVSNLPEVVQQRAEACLDRIQAQEALVNGGVDPLHDPTATIVATA